MRLHSSRFIEGVDAAPIDVEILAMLRRIDQNVNQLRKEVRRMANESPLDQAIDGLGTAVAGKLAEDQIVNGLAAQATNETAETAKLQALTDSLNQETAAEQAANPAPSVPVTPVAVPVVPVAVPVVPVVIPSTANVVIDNTLAPPTTSTT